MPFPLLAKDSVLDLAKLLEQEEKKLEEEAQHRQDLFEYDDDHHLDAVLPPVDSILLVDDDDMEISFSAMMNDDEDSEDEGSDEDEDDDNSFDGEKSCNSMATFESGASPPRLQVFEYKHSFDNSKTKNNSFTGKKGPLLNINTAKPKLNRQRAKLQSLVANLPWNKDPTPPETEETPADTPAETVSLQAEESESQPITENQPDAPRQNSLKGKQQQDVSPPRTTLPPPPPPQPIRTFSVYLENRFAATNNKKRPRSILKKVSVAPQRSRIRGRRNSTRSSSISLCDSSSVGSACSDGSSLFSSSSSCISVDSSISSCSITLDSTPHNASTSASEGGTVDLQPSSVKHVTFPLEVVSQVCFPSPITNGDSDWQPRDLWWQPCDYQEFRKVAELISQALHDGNTQVLQYISGGASTPNDDAADEPDTWWRAFGHSSRGLEHVVSIEEGEQRKAQAKQAVRAVLEEQQKQRRSGRAMAVERIRAVSIPETQLARDMARNRGYEDALHAANSNQDESLMNSWEYQQWKKYRAQRKLQRQQCKEQRKQQTQPQQPKIVRPLVYRAQSFVTPRKLNQPLRRYVGAVRLERALARSRRLYAAASRIQRAWKRQLLVLRSGVVPRSAQAASSLLRTHDSQRTAAIRLQALVRLMLAKRHFHGCRDAVFRIQRCWKNRQSKAIQYTSTPRSSSSEEKRFSPSSLTRTTSSSLTWTSNSSCSSFGSEPMDADSAAYLAELLREEEDDEELSCVQARSFVPVQTRIFVPVMDTECETSSKSFASWWLCPMFLAMALFGIAMIAGFMNPAGEKMASNTKNAVVVAPVPTESLIVTVPEETSNDPVEVMSPVVPVMASAVHDTGKSSDIAQINDFDVLSVIAVLLNPFAEENEWQAEENEEEEEAAEDTLIQAVDDITPVHLPVELKDIAQEFGCVDDDDVEVVKCMKKIGRRPYHTARWRKMHRRFMKGWAFRMPENTA